MVCHCSNYENRVRSAEQLCLRVHKFLSTKKRNETNLDVFDLVYVGILYRIYCLFVVDDTAILYCSSDRLFRLGVSHAITLTVGRCFFDFRIQL